MQQNRPHRHSVALPHQQFSASVIRGSDAPVPTGVTPVGRSGLDAAALLSAKIAAAQVPYRELVVAAPLLPTPPDHRVAILNPLPPCRTAEARRLRVDRYSPGCPTSVLAQRTTTLFELLFLEDGSGRHQIGPHAFQAVPGDLFLIAPGTLRDAGGLMCTTSWLVTFRTDLVELRWSRPDPPPRICHELCLDAFFNLGRPGRGAYRIPSETRPQWLARLTSLQHELRAGDLWASAAACAILELLLIDVLRVMRPRFSQYSPQSRPMLVDVFQFIDQRFRVPIGLADVAKAVARSPSYLTDLVRRETGRTVLQWIIERRMAEARRLLLGSDVPVKIIGQQIGYDDSGHFIRLFRRVHGLTPQRWRSMNRSRFD